MLTTSQQAAVKAAILAETDPAIVAARTPSTRDDRVIASFFSALHPTFIVWKTKVSIDAVGDNFNGAELAGLTTGNQTRLQTIALYSPNGVNPSLADRRLFFDDVFSGAGGATTRANLAALWKRNATRTEKEFATGAGTTASPATVTYEGGVTLDEVSAMLNS